MGGERRSKCNTDATLIWVLGMVWLLSITITPSSAQNCWNKISNCLEDKSNKSITNPEFNPLSPTFNQSEYFCCPLIQQVALNEKQCFCKIVPLVQQNSENGTDVRKVFNWCNITDHSLSLESFCGVASAPPPSPSSIHRLPPPTPPPPDATHSPSSSAPPGKKKMITIIAVASAGVLVLIAVGICIYAIKAMKKPHAADSEIVTDSRATEAPALSPPPAAGVKDDSITAESLQYEFEALQKATNNFSEDHKIGQGGFGIVYKGTLPNGQEVAVKRLSRGSWHADKEFKNEAALVAKLQHRNLVRLVGFCLPEQERLLVYEFVQNKSLDQILFDPEKQKQLYWSRRYNIIRGIARGMLYLHEDSPTRIIHRDLKAANVLLDAEMNPKIADFGTAKICSIEQTHGDTSRVIGTYGYMAPEYLLHGQFSVKSDVYSFGVLVLEIVSGKRISSSMHQFGSNGENLLDYGWRCFRDGRPFAFMDPTLKDSYIRNEIIRCIHVGLLCVQEDMRNRPTMEKVVLMFNSESDVSALLLPEHPGILQTKYAEQSTSSNTGSMPGYVRNEASFITEPTAR